MLHNHRLNFLDDVEWKRSRQRHSGQMNGTIVFNLCFVSKNLNHSQLLSSIRNVKKTTSNFLISIRERILQEFSKKVLCRLEKVMAQI